MSSRRLTRLGLLVALGLILNLVERQLPPILPMPGVRLGLANLATLLALALDGPGGALAVWLLRFGLASLFGGTLLGPGFLVGAAGGLAAWLVMAAASRSSRWGTLGVSLAGAVAHHLGQLGAAAAITARAEVLSLLSLMLAVALPVGFLTGLAAGLILSRLLEAGVISRVPGWLGPAGGGKNGPPGQAPVQSPVWLGPVRRADLALAGLVAAVALAAWLGGSPGGGQALTAEVTVAGRVVMELDLQEDAVYPLEGEGFKMLVQVQDGAVRVAESDCEEQICVLTGWVRSRGGLIVCAPNRVVVLLRGGGDSGPDVILR